MACWLIWEHLTWRVDSCVSCVVWCYPVDKWNWAPRGEIIVLPDGARHPSIIGQSYCQKSALEVICYRRWRPTKSWCHDIAQCYNTILWPDWTCHNVAYRLVHVFHCLNKSDTRWKILHYATPKSTWLSADSIENSSVSTVWSIAVFLEGAMHVVLRFPNDWK